MTMANAWPRLRPAFDELQLLRPTVNRSRPNSPNGPRPGRIRNAAFFRNIKPTEKAATHARPSTKPGKRREGAFPGQPGQFQQRPEPHKTAVTAFCVSPDKLCPARQNRTRLSLLDYCLREMVNHIHARGRNSDRSPRHPNSGCLSGATKLDRSARSSWPAMNPTRPSWLVDPKNELLRGELNFPG